MNLNFFLSGIYMAMFAASGLFFFKFYWTSKDHFFKYFAWACWLLALERVGLLFVDKPFQGEMVADDPRAWVYLFRLVAFLLIVWAIIWKNKSEKKLPKN